MGVQIGTMRMTDTINGSTDTNDENDGYYKCFSIFQQVLQIKNHWCDQWPELSFPEVKGVVVGGTSVDLVSGSAPSFVGPCCMLVVRCLWWRHSGCPWPASIIDLWYLSSGSDNRSERNGTRYGHDTVHHLHHRVGILLQRDVLQVATQPVHGWDGESLLLPLRPTEDRIW